MKKNKGIALISVFWAMIALSVIALSVMSIGKTQIKRSNNIYTYNKSQYIAEAGINFIISELASRGAVQSIPNGISQKNYKFSGETIELDIIPEEGKIDLNTSDESLISGVLAYFGVQENKALRIAEAIHSKKTNSSDGRFYAVEDVIGIDEFPPEIFECIEPYLTVYSQRNGVDLNLASSEMNAFVKWADEKRWGGKNWLNTDGGSTGGMVSGKSSVLQNIRSYSGRAFSIKATVKSGENINIEKTAIVRITGNIREPYWTYLWETSFSREKPGCVHL